ncbi:MAG: hypothetical protein A2X66_02880 [Ignavibacteria bacterium GWA2_54_16]|nr:MAG: hypothetical protein A2X66_02880 [Ignavibacteria bacterium GWA2_54_16]
MKESRLFRDSVRLHVRMFFITKSSPSMQVHPSRSRIKIDLHPPEPKAVEALISVERSSAFKHWMDK